MKKALMLAALVLMPAMSMATPAKPGQTVVPSTISLPSGSDNAFQIHLQIFRGDMLLHDISGNAWSGSHPFAISDWVDHVYAQQASVTVPKNSEPFVYTAGHFQTGFDARIDLGQQTSEGNVTARVQLDLSHLAGMIQAQAEGMKTESPELDRISIDEGTVKLKSGQPVILGDARRLHVKLTVTHRND